jgi:membrane-bound serine protease (ClpP class)
MKHIFPYCFLLCCCSFSLAAQKVISIKIDGSINPVSAGFIGNAIEKAGRENAACLLIHLNTPGGLVKSTRVIVSDILQSPVPVVVYVSPAGGHAGSAGVFITMAAHVAAMAPGTNIGAAHPVAIQASMDSTMSNKATNDAAAFIRTIAEKRNRNLEWAEDAVRNSVSITETEAVKLNVVDLIAKDDADLFRLINGRKVITSSGSHVLKTTGVPLESHEMNFVEKLLDIISNPNIAYILLLLGLYGVMFELYSPGAILPGIIGVISLLLAFYSMHSLPVNYAGVGLIIFAVILFLLELKVVSHGMLAIGAVISLLLGSMMLMKSGSGLEMMRISRSVIISATAFTAFFFLFIIGMGIKAQRQKVTTGVEAMIGHMGEVMQPLNPAGTIRVQGEVWNAISLTGPVEAGKKVRIKEMRNLALYVEPIDQI